MRKVGVQGESGDRPPQLAEKDPVSIRTAAFEPLHRGVPCYSDEKK